MATLDELWSRAYAQVGPQQLAEYDEVHTEGLRQLVGAVASARSLGEPAKRRIEQEIVFGMIKSLLFERDLIAHPEIRNVPTAAPMFIVGFGRTGSTLLHNLLALDSAARAPRFWELWVPSPPPRSGAHGTDPRIAAASRYLAQIAAVMPGIFRIHPMAPQAPDECHWMMRHGPHHTLRFPASAYWEWFRQLEPDALRRLYAYYKLQTQHLRLFFPGARWVSKSLVHQLYFPVLFDVFPDACVIRLHRDPCRCIPSLASLAARMRSIYQQAVDAAELGDFMLEWFLLGAARMMQADAKYDSKRFFDVPYDDLIADPIRVVRAMYAHFGQNYTCEFDRAMRRYLLDNAAQHKSYRHAYELEQFGLSPSRVVKRTSEYLDWLQDRVPAAGVASR
jgi:Sulfotransferase family